MGSEGSEGSEAMTVRVHFIHGLEGSPNGSKARLLARHFDAVTPAMDTASKLMPTAAPTVAANTPCPVTPKCPSCACNASPSACQNTPNDTLGSSSPAASMPSSADSILSSADSSRSGKFAPFAR